MTVRSFGTAKRAARGQDASRAAASSARAVFHEVCKSLENSELREV